MKHIDLLTAAERARLEWAMAEYAVIQEKMALDAMQGKPLQTLMEQSFLMRMDGDADEQQKAQWMSSFANAPKASWVTSFVEYATNAYIRSGNSALLRRLIVGKQGLVFCPPKASGHPWYDIVDTPGKYPVHVSLISRTADFALDDSSTHIGERAEIMRNELGISHLCVNGDYFQITDLSESAYQLLWMAYSMSDSPNERVYDPETDQCTSVVGLDHPLWNNVMHAYRLRPWFELSQGRWPAWRLYTENMGVGTIDADAAERILSDGPWTSMLPSQRLPFDLHRAHVNFGILTPAMASNAFVSPGMPPSILRILRVVDGCTPASENVPQPSNTAASANTHSFLNYSQLSWVMIRSQAWRTLEPKALNLAHVEPPPPVPRTL